MVEFGEGLRASARHALLFSPSGQRINESPAPANSRAIFHRLSTACDLDPQRICINYQLQLPSNIQEVEVLTQAASSVQLWTTSSGAHLGSQYQGLFAGSGLPFERDGAGSILLDEFGNQKLSGPILISLAPPPELIEDFAANEVARNIYYVLPDLQNSQGELLWAGIYINPKFNPLMDCQAPAASCFSMTGFGSFSLRSIIIYQLGLILGIAASALPDSVMFPVQNPSWPKNYSNLREHEKNLVRKIYQGPEPEDLGSLRGRVTSGDGGAGRPGASVFALAADRMDAVIRTQSLDLFSASTTTRQGGEFVFEALIPGEYLIFVESPLARGLSKNKFDEWVKRFGADEYFAPELYDGRDRESNNEPADFSPQLFRVAARVVVTAGEETSGVHVITQRSQSGSAQLVAGGSTNEILSDYEFKDLKNLIRDEIRSQLDRPEKAKGSSGCAVGTRPEKSGWGFIFVFWIALCLWFRFRWGQKAKLHPAGCR
jgi:hypothetical protein